MKPFSFVCLFLLVSLISISSGCGSGDSPGGVGCSANIVDGIVVHVIDAQTHANIATGATGTIQDGSYTETLRPTQLDGAGNTISLSGAPERTGAYTITIQKAGYQTFVLQNVVVTKNVCHVNTVTVDANLLPATAN
jgi:hypothetical protein